jgi:hypothetical protein
MKWKQLPNRIDDEKIKKLYDFERKIKLFAQKRIGAPLR